MSIAVVILAAGQGTRMKSQLPKVLHPVGGKPMVVRAVETAEQLTNFQPAVVIGHGADEVKKPVGSRAQFVLQAQQLGTGHAVMQAAEALRGKTELVIVYYADMPLLRSQTLQQLVEMQRANSGPMSLLTVISPDPRGFGRIVRGADGSVKAIVEERDATPEQRQINELNVGAYVFQSAWLWETLATLKPHANGEYYLTDTVEIAIAQGKSVAGTVCTELDEVIGVNTRVHLSEAEVALRRRVNTELMLSGVTILDPSTTYIQEAVKVGQDTTIYPNTYLQGNTTIGANCTIGPNSIIRDSRIGASCTVLSSLIEESIMEDHVEIGPFGHLRPGAYLEEHVHMGNFGEVKNSRLGRYTRMGHFSYVGDAEIGQDVNVGAGVITCNFDGKQKHKTVIGDHAFIGSDTMLVAPLTIGANASTGAGSVVKKDVPDGQVVVGVPAKPLEPKPQNNQDAARAEEKQQTK